MGWFVTLLLGEQHVSNANDARRAAERAAEEATTAASSAYCKAGLASAPAAGARVNPSVISNGKPETQNVMSMLGALGLGSQRTFPNYTLPLSDARTSVVQAADNHGQKAADDHNFAAERRRGCLERPLDTPRGSIEDYRKSMWSKNLQGY